MLCDIHVMTPAQLTMFQQGGQTEIISFRHHQCVCVCACVHEGMYACVYMYMKVPAGAHVCA